MKSIQKSFHKPRGGFTLVELIMTMVVVGIVSIPLSFLVIGHMESIVVSSDMTIALNLARFEMEIVNSSAYTDILIGTFVNANNPNSDYDVTRIVTYEQGDDLSAESLKRITVQVTRAGDADVIISLVTFIARNITYGV